MSSNNNSNLNQQSRLASARSAQMSADKDQSSGNKAADVTAQEASESHNHRLQKQIARLSGIENLQRFSFKSEIPSSTRRQASVKSKIGLQRSISKKDIKRPSLAMVPDMEDPLLFTNPRRAPAPPVESSVGFGISGSGGDFLTSALDSVEVQEASVLAMELAATKPMEAAVLRRKAEAAREADLAAEKARSAALVAEEAAVKRRREVAYMVRSLKGDM